MCVCVYVLLCVFVCLSVCVSHNVYGSQRTTHVSVLSFHPRETTRWCSLATSTFAHWAITVAWDFLRYKFYQLNCDYVFKNIALQEKCWSMNGPTFAGEYLMSTMKTSHSTVLHQRKSKQQGMAWPLSTFKWPLAFNCSINDKHPYFAWRQIIDAISQAYFMLILGHFLWRQWLSVQKYT